MARSISSSPAVLIISGSRCKTFMELRRSVSLLWRNSRFSVMLAGSPRTFCRLLLLLTWLYSSICSLSWLFLTRKNPIALGMLSLTLRRTSAKYSSILWRSWLTNAFCESYLTVLSFSMIVDLLFL